VMMPYNLNGAGEPTQYDTTYTQVTCVWVDVYLPRGWKIVAVV